MSVTKGNLGGGSVHAHYVLELTKTTFALIFLLLTRALACPVSTYTTRSRLRVLSKSSNVMGLLARNPDLDYVHPETEVYTGLWCLHAGATAFLAARLWTKLTRRHGLWWDDYILIIAWVRKALPHA